MKDQEIWSRYFGKNKAELWMNYFDTPEEALEWANKFVSKSVAYWWLYHFRDLLQKGKITLDEISEWYEFLYNLGCLYSGRDYVNAADGKKFVEVFKTIDNAKLWLKHFSDIYTASKWHKFFTIPEIAKIMSEYFQSPYEAKKWLDQKLSEILYDFLKDDPRKEKNIQDLQEIELLKKIFEKIKKYLIKG